MPRSACGSNGPFAMIGLEARVIDDEIHVREQPRRPADVGAAPVFLRKAGEQQALVDADVVDAERARLLDERDADVRAVQLPAHALRPPLRVALPGGDRVARDRILHELQRLDLRPAVRHHHGMQEQPVGALHPLDQHPHALGLLERERIALGQLRHEGQHGDLGVAVQEHVLDELLGREAVDRIAIAARALREGARMRSQ